MTFLYEIRNALLAYNGGYLGGLAGTVDADPDIGDIDAARSIISASLYDGEKLSNAYGGMYFWVPRYSDQVRAEQRGYRVKFVTIFEPPSTGSFVIRMYGYGEAIEMPVGSPAESVQTVVQNISEDLIDVDVFLNADGSYEFHLPQRIGMGASAGRMRAAGGLGVVLMNKDFSQPLPKGAPWVGSSVIPFETADNITGIHTCINNALHDVIFDDLFPVESMGNPGLRHGIQLWGVAPWMMPDQITGYYAPTDWEAQIVFIPPTSGTYTVALQTSVLYGPYAVPLSWNTSGADLQAALRSISGIPTSASNHAISVTPQGVAPSYTITWRTQNHHASLVASRGTIASSVSTRLREPFPLALLPWYTADANQPTLSDPGFEEGASWFVGTRRRADSRMCPQTYPRKADGTLDITADPIPGSEWIDSVEGLQYDLDQTFIPMDRIVPVAFRYCLSAVAASTQGGDQQRWDAAGHDAAVNAAGGLIYGPITARGNKVGRGGSVAPLGNKSYGYWLPDR